MTLLPLQFIQRCIRIACVQFERWPRLIACAAFLLGVGSFVLVDRQAALASWVMAALLLAWLWLLLERPLSLLSRHWFGFELPPPLVRYTVQMAHQESFFFVVPFFFVTTSWASGQSVFFGLLMAGALVALIDPLYYRWLAVRRSLYLAYHAIALFVLLLVALPIVLQISTAQSYNWALAAALTLSLPALVEGIRAATGWWRLRPLAVLVVLLAAAWLGRIWVPPATLWLTDAAIATGIDSDARAPVTRLGQVPLAVLREQGLYAYTAIRAPRGLSEHVYHVWYHEGREVDRIALDITGGREAGYRAWTHKRNFPPRASGHWQVRVLTQGGQMIGVVRFRVIPSWPRRSLDQVPVGSAVSGGDASTKAKRGTVAPALATDSVNMASGRTQSWRWP